MRFGDMLGMWSDYSYVDDSFEPIDFDLFIKWLHGDNVERERIELTLTDEGKIAFREKEKSLGFFKDKK